MDLFLTLWTVTSDRTYSELPPPKSSNFDWVYQQLQGFVGFTDRKRTERPSDFIQNSIFGSKAPVGYAWRPEVRHGARQGADSIATEAGNLALSKCLGTGCQKLHRIRWAVGSISRH